MRLENTYRVDHAGANSAQAADVGNGVEAILEDGSTTGGNGSAHGLGAS